MPALVPSSHYGTVTWLGRVPDRAAALSSTARHELVLTFAGIEGEAHSGLTRPSCSRVTGQYPQDTEIRNTRQLTILSQEELDAIARDMGLSALDPALVGASMVIAGLPDFTHLPPSSRLQAAGGATLVVDMENHPCTLAAREIEGRHPGLGKRFKPAAEGRRGVTAWVEREGKIPLGAQIRLHLPTQRAWQP